eukprot:TRINITY_DN191_c0_g1_i1.p1 TRINITY_DN191_c0_g1~~TRINITY_DN191_c0_g1_i1.p1  ORF type:complete len:149 (+),score=31.33 TRINITY_DN191_c0_g1_i1:29-448(+)
MSYESAEFISVQVKEPTTITDEEGQYTRYSVVTETTYPEYRQRGKPFTVYRRYREFCRLRAVLKEKLDQDPKKAKFGELKELPGDSVFTMFSKKARIEPEFVEKRRKSLEEFIDYVANHNFFRFEPILHSFLQDEVFKG